MHKYICLKTHSYSYRVRDAIKVVTKMVIYADPESKVPITMLFPYRYSKWILKQLDSLDHSGKVLIEEKINTVATCLLKTADFVHFHLILTNCQKWPFS